MNEQPLSCCACAARAAELRWPAGRRRASSGETFRLFSRYLPPAAGLKPPPQWGVEAYQRELFGDGAASIKSYPRTAVFRYRSAAENVDFFRTYYGPTLRAFETLPEEKRQALYDDMVSLAQASTATGARARSPSWPITWKR